MNPRYPRDLLDCHYTILSFTVQSGQNCMHHIIVKRSLDVTYATYYLGGGGGGGGGTGQACRSDMTMYKTHKSIPRLSCFS